MKVTTFCKFGVSLGAAALLVGALAVPANADPATGTFGTLVGLGSDTTQDVVNGIATGIGGGQIASYNANSGGATVVTRKGGVAIPRVSGSGAGRDELLVSIGQLANKSGVALADGTSTTVDSSVVGQLDFARSSGGPASTLADGVVAYVPFARDAVDVAFAPGSPLSKVPLYIGDGTEGKSEPTLRNIYSGDVAYVYFNADGSYNSAGQTLGGAPSGTKAYKLQPILPKFGSGTRSYFIGQIGGTDASGYTSTHPNVTDTDNGTPIEEHNGQPIVDLTTSDTLAIAPFSVSQWVAQANGAPGVTDRRAGVELAVLGKTQGSQTAATTGSGTAYATNPSYAGFVRDVYNIVPSRLADDPSSQIAKTFVGSQSLVCKQTAVITRYGFLPEPATSAATTCGYAQLRAFAASTSTTTLSIPDSGQAGSTVKATATVASFGNGGGTVLFRSGTTTLATATIARSATSVTADVPLATAGTTAVTATFVPALGGVGSSASAASQVAVSSAATVSKTTVTSNAFVVGRLAVVTAKIAGGDSAGGTVTFRNNGAVLGTTEVAPGASSAVTSFYPNHTSYSIVATYVPATSGTKGSASAALAVKVAKGTPHVNVPTLPTVKSTATTKVTMTVTGAGSVAPTGQVQIREGSKVIVGNTSIVKGAVTFTIPRLSVGTHTLVFFYNGSALWNATHNSGTTLKVVK